ncbi:hypothetical protein RJ639_046900 [Escallonia herrerae]|uniref:Protein EARLY FLOWERING 4 domain-containing protein n=1 Tax=Escallonia herrerae TaxID=1293975 RepID=A0AA89B1N0_9ASTE|nr:hypothetical protein RJ639_046900 [Escallonia herrerae]
MTPLDSSSSAGELSMEDNNSNGHRHTAATKKRSHAASTFSDKEAEHHKNNGGEGDAEVWDNFTDSFRQVQSVLDRNRVLIQQVNENHQSKIHENMVKNVALIQEINGNISKVVALYSDLSTNFSSVFHQRNDAKNDDVEGGDMQA